MGRLELRQDRLEVRESCLITLDALLESAQLRLELPDLGGALREQVVAERALAIRDLHEATGLGQLVLESDGSPEARIRGSHHGQVTRVVG